MCIRDKLHVVERVPGGHPLEHVRVPCEQRSSTPPRVRRVHDAPHGSGDHGPGAHRTEQRTVDRRVDGDHAQVRSPAKLRERAGRALLVAIPLLFLGYFFAYPLGAILTRSLFQSGHLDLAPFADVFRRSTLRGAIWFTVWQATASMLLTLAVALPAAYL